ncbi:terminal uridylyltransferase 4 isoform X2 [Erpetoichthys calabaricus]|uniref:terminal uridylyltransferase 4 isoform X2 n=1 Tax=Erpetoichthys calabaricus TaxID=27687 RepID=UPI002234DD42|nr:terminal uridylyltransferase 4 isoform X2 [Erpetoichthys calabaricus]
MEEEEKSPRNVVKSTRSEGKTARVTTKHLKEATVGKEGVRHSNWYNNIKTRLADEAKDAEKQNCPVGWKNISAGLPEQGRLKANRLTGRGILANKGKPKVGRSHEQDDTVAVLDTPTGKEDVHTSKQSKSADVAAPVVSKDEQQSIGETAVCTEDVVTNSSEETGILQNGPPPLEIQSITAPVIDESSLNAEQQLGLKQAEERLVRDYIHRLEKRSVEYPNYLYLCKLCSVHIENIQGAHKHIKEKRHKKNIMEKEEENELRALPPPSPAQLEAVTAAVLEAVKQQGISEDEFIVRQAIVTEMEKIIQQHLPACTLQLYGSCLTRFAFKTSDINIDVKFPPTMTQPDVLIKVLEIFKNTSCFCDVESDFHAKVPVVFCRDVASGLMFKVSAGNDVACLTSSLLAALGKLEPRLIPLVLAFRFWARLCYIDCQAEGGIPSYSFSLMVIFFLQQRKDPILPHYLGSWVEGFNVKHVDEYRLKGIEEDKFVLWEHKPANSGTDGKSKLEQKKTAGKKLDNHTDANGEKWQSKIKQGKARLALETKKDVTIGQLWLELLRFYTLEFALEEYIICIRIKELLSREIKNWPRRRIAIEDPFALKRNVARSLNSQMVFEYILERFRTTYRYFACPQSKNGTKIAPLRGRRRKKRGAKKTCKHKVAGAAENCPDESMVPNIHCTDADSKSADEQREQDKDKEDMDGTEEEEDEEEEDDDKYSNDDEFSITGEFSRRLEDLSDSEEGSFNFALKTKDLTPKSEVCIPNCTSSLVSSSYLEQVNNSEERSLRKNNLTSREYSNSTDCLEDITVSTSRSGSVANGMTESEKEYEADEEKINAASAISLQDLFYEFDRTVFTGGKPPTVVCSICRRDGHSKNECPEDFKKMDLKPLPPLTDRYREILDEICRMCYNERSVPIEQQKREQILAGLERFIRKEYDEKARLCLFGSSKNGFGFRDSDLDICMTLEGHETAEKLNCKEIIESLAKILKKHSGLRNILPITTAKVPIVKFEHKQSGLEGDISLYNTLAQHNTRMLATYAAIDSRVQFLGYTMKVFAKRCDIGDASRGSLSSYAYILMVLYFLQQRKPPVIPVLQEIFDGKIVPQRMVDGWNAFFFDDINELQRLPDLGKNSESVGELWLGLLRFYTEEFDFKEYVISIRQKKLLTTFEKQWTSKCIAIEDPFDLNHNLGAGVSRKMTNFIMKAFINGRKLFGTPYYPQPGTEMEYFFDSKVLTDGEHAPNDRCCRICGKIGHYMKDCPKRRRMKKKENEKDDDLKEDEREPRERRCFHCGDTGHVRRDCPEYRQLRQRNTGVPVSQTGQPLGSPQTGSIAIPQVAIGPQDRPLRTRQPSECSDHRQTPPYSPQPIAFSKSTSQPSSSSQSIVTPSANSGPPKQLPVQIPLLNFSPGTPFHHGMHTLGLLQPHQQQHHPIPIPSAPWPIHGPVIQTSSAGGLPSPPNLNYSLRSAPTNGNSSSTSSPNPLNLNDPSIIYAQPAGRPLGIPSTGRDGQWHNQLLPGALVGNGTVGKSDQGYQGQFGKVNPGFLPWDQSAAGHFSIQASWPYMTPPNFLPQGNGGLPQNKTIISQGSVIHGSQHFPLLHHGQHNINLNFIHQKK